MSKKNSNNNNLYKKNFVSKAELENFNLSTHLINFLWNEPFYSRILRSLEKVETDIIPTAGVSCENGNITLFWNREFLAGLTNKKMLGLLKHECLHLVFGHTSERRRDPHLIWNYSTDLAINSTIPEEELPDGGLIPGVEIPLEENQKEKMTDDQIKTYEGLSKLIASLPRNKTSEYYFEKLSKSRDMQQMVKDESEGEGFFLGFDDHEGWDSLSEDEKEVMHAKIKEVIKEAAKEANSRNWGSVSHELRTEIMQMISSEIKWESLLRRFCGFTKRDDRRSSVRKLNKKYMGIHPGYKKIYKPAIAVYIEESGSVSDEEIQKFYAELDNLSNKTEFHVYKFDFSVDEKSSFIWKKRKNVKPVRNLTGGTCFKSVTNHANKNKKKFDAYIILTDGAAPKPPPSFAMRRCWVLASNCNLAFKADKKDIVINIK